MACYLLALLAWVALITLQMSAMLSPMIKTTHSGLVESAPYTYPFGLSHSVRLYSLLVL